MLLMLSIIWISQILRLVNLKFSLSTQIIEIISITILVLPSYLNPVLPFILLISFYFLNSNLNSSNQNLIINQYVEYKHKIIITFLIKLILLVLIFFTSEIVSPKLYQAYKQKEIDLRNNFKLGLPSNNEFHIENELSIFFKANKNQNFTEVEALIYEDSQFIKSETAFIELDKQGFNIIFKNGIRIKLNENEKSKTTFEKFTYNIIKNNLETLYLDKEHFNTLGLLKNTEKEFQHHAHNRVIQYLIIFSILIFSNKIIFKNNQKNIDLNKFILFLFLLFLYLVNSFLLYQINKELINILQYYLFNILGLIIFNFYLAKIYDYK